MKSTIFVPEKINVGFRNREDTYTKKLSYIIYYDEKGKLRKETSWNSWRDKSIDNVITENVPTSGFVLNKKAGGYSTGWNHRQTYVRVYDPRGFEFEIDIANLLYILENTNSIKGKGLEGEFVYGWDGKELILVPVDSPDYLEIAKYSKILKSDYKLRAKEIKIGATYLTKDNQEWIYLGKFDEWENNWNHRSRDKMNVEHYVPQNIGKRYFFKTPHGVQTVRSLTKFVALISDECVENYADLIDHLETLQMYSPVDHEVTQYIPITAEEIQQQWDLPNSWKFRSVTLYLSDGEIELKREYGDDHETVVGYSYRKKNPKYDNRHYLYSEPYYIEEKFFTLEEFIEMKSPTKRQAFLKNGNKHNGGSY